MPKFAEKASEKPSSASRGPYVVDARKAKHIYPASTHAEEPPRRTAEQLLLVAGNAAMQLDERLSSIRELLALGNLQLPSLVVAQLSLPDLAPAWRNELVIISEMIDVSGAARESLLHALESTALALRADALVESQPVLWAAIRRMATLLPPARIGKLLAFLQPDDLATTRQVALQATQSILATAPLPTGAETEKFAARVLELARKHLDADLVVTGENQAFVLNAFCAAVLVAPDASDDLVARLVGTKRTALIAFAARRLRELSVECNANHVPRETLATSADKLVAAH